MSTDGKSLIIYNSSAGSGKTYTLVLEYLKLVLKKPSLFKKILAVTFTNKATAEMKDRIISALSELSEEKNNDLLEKCRSNTGLSDQVISERAAKVLGLILHDYSAFSVSTIDSFFTRMVRSMSREMHLNFGYNLELDTTTVIREISDRLFEDIGKDRQLRSWLEDFIMDQIDDDKQWTVEQHVHEIAKTLFSEEYRVRFPLTGLKPTIEFIGKLKAINKTFSEELKNHGNRFLQVLSQHNLTYLDLKYGKSSAGSVFNSLSKKGYFSKFQLGPRFEKTLQNHEEWFSKTQIAANRNLADLAKNVLAPLANDLKKYYDENLPQFNSARSVLDYIHMSGIIGALDEKLKEFREEENLIMLSDHNLLLRRSMENNDAEFIYEKMGNRYTHFMLDEFQDTSGFQWSNLFPLVHEAISKGMYTLIVGDPKQSIYRWRGSNMELLRKTVLDDFSAFSSMILKKNLADNYRSREQIVTFNNNFFTAAPNVFFPAGGVQAADHPYMESGEIVQTVKRGAGGEGYIKIRFVTPDEEEDTEITNGSSEDANEDSESGGSWMRFAELETLETIADLLQKGFRYQDICILVRNNDHAKKIAGVLIDHGITQITSPESMQLSRSTKVLILIAALQLLNNPTDQVSLATLSYHYGKLNKQSEDDALLFKNNISGFNTLPPLFKKSLAELRRLPLFETIERMIVIFGLHQQPDAYLQRFTDVIIEFSGKTTAGIPDFLDWWDENKDKENCSVITPSGLDSIKIMTIHKSKGLQFPVVIMPYATWKCESDQKSSIWVNSNQPPFDENPAYLVKVKSALAESYFQSDYANEIIASRLDNMNLFYVAFTRAEEHLYVFCKQFKSNLDPKNEKWSANSSRIIWRILQTRKEWSDALESSNGELVEIGSPLHKLGADKSPAIVQQSLQEWISEPWKQRIQLLVSKEKISIDDPDKPDPTYGLHFHTLAALLDQTTDVTALVDHHLSTRPVAATLRDRLIADLLFLKNQSEQSGWFDPAAETINESEIMLPDGKILRPDRLLLKNKEAVVIDYKTGDEDESHALQVKKYAGVLQNMGYTKTTLFLVYPMLKKSVEVAA